MTTEKIEQAFTSAGIGKRISCNQAFEIAAKFQIHKKDIADYCNSHGIKIYGCQLGCFK